MSAIRLDLSFLMECLVLTLGNDISYFKVCMLKINIALPLFSGGAGATRGSNQSFWLLVLCSQVTPDDAVAHTNVNCVLSKHLTIHYLFDSILLLVSQVISCYIFLQPYTFALFFSLSWRGVHTQWLWLISGDPLLYCLSTCKVSALTHCITSLAQTVHV